MNVTKFIRSKPKTIIVMPSNTLNDRRILSAMNIIGNYNIKFVRLTDSPIWWSPTPANPKILTNVLNKKLGHSEFLVLQAE